MSVVEFGVPPEIAFDYLVDPRNRPEWQSSLRRVEDYDGDLSLGATWTDVTWPGLRPRMSLTEYDRPRRWAEHGRWRGVEATLALEFRAVESGCLVRPDFTITGPGAPLLTASARFAIVPDLRRAARLVEREYRANG